MYISSVPGPIEFGRIRRSQKPGIQHVLYGMPESGFSFHSLLQGGLANHQDVSVTSICGRSIDSRIHFGHFWPGSEELTVHGYKVFHVPLINFRLIKLLSAAIGFFLETLKWRWKTRFEKERLVIFDGSYISSLPPVLLALTGASSRKLGVFCDIYSYMANVQDATGRGGARNRILSKLAGFLYSFFDGMVFLADEMNKVVNPRRKPYMVIEGLTDGFRTIPQNTEKFAYPTVVYAGAIRKEYGLENLVNSLEYISNPKLKILIFGDGDYRKSVVEAGQFDSRLEWGGLLPQDELFEIEQRAWILINPRSGAEEFTKYSFPSKTMEYLSTGTPVLMARLPGIPSEYDQVLSYFDGDTPRDIAEGIENLLKQGCNELHSLGLRGQKFAMTEKSNLLQSHRLIEFARNLAT